MKLTFKKHAYGFTLIELAVTMTILALLIGGMMIPMATRYEQQAYSDTQARLDKALEALTGYAIINGKLPCPSIGADGVALAVNGSLCGSAANSDPSGTATNVSWGDLPWATLGIGPPNNTDAWGFRLRYVVCTNLTQDSPSLTNANLTGCGITVKDNSTPASPINLITNGSFIVYSHGRNGYGGTMGGNPANPATANPTSVDELANLPSTESTSTNRRTFISRVRTPPITSASPTGALVEFDDLLSWMSPNSLTAKLVSAGVYSP